MNNTIKGIFAAALLALPVAAVLGWILNIIAIVNHTGDFTVMLALRFFGIMMAPLGAILGLFV